MKVDPRLYYKLDGTNNLTADFQAGGFKLSHVADPVSATDAATMGWADGKFLPLVGGTVSGLISCSPAPTADAHLANKAYVDSIGGGAGWEDVRIMDVGLHVAGDGACRIDFHAQSGVPDYDFVISRNGGVNGGVGIENKGTGNIDFMLNGGSVKIDNFRVLTENYHPLPSPLNADTLDGLDSTLFAIRSNVNYFTDSCIRNSPDTENGYVCWRTDYSGMNIYMGQANGRLGWQCYISSTSGDAPSASKSTLYVVSSIAPDYAGNCDLGEASLPFGQVFLETYPYQTSDLAKLRNVATLSSIDADFLLSLSPKVYEITPTAVTGSPFLADIPAPVTAKTRLGFVAQDVDNALIAAGYNPDDFALTTGEPGHRSVSTGELIPLLVKKIQDLETRISALENP